MMRDMVPKASGPAFSCSQVAEVSRRVAATSSRLEKIEQLAGCLRSCASDEIPIAVAYLAGYLPRGRIGIGYATLRRVLSELGDPADQLALTLESTTDPSPLALLEVDAALDRLARTTGPGSNAVRARLLRDLLSRCPPDERDFLTGLLLGDLRQGALEGVMLEAIARAAALPDEQVRRAFMLTGDLGSVGRAALVGGAKALAKFGVRLFRPLQPMLAQTAEDVADALERLGEAVFEWKLDGARVQVHRRGREARVFTRRLNEVTAAVPEIVESVLHLPVDEIVLDGEAMALRADRTPHPFQTTMRRFGRKLDVERMRRELPLSCFFFDCLHLNGTTLIDVSLSERYRALAGVATEGMLLPRLVTSDPSAAEAFLAEAREAGHEGIIAKALGAPYEMGRRGRGWLKIKPANTLDLVVLAAEWGSGRRRGWLSNLHLGARDPESGEFVMLGKTFKGLTDELLEWQTRELQARETHRDGNVVHVRPELVVEVTFNEVQDSPRYEGGLALRFARVKAYRPDKAPGEADTVESVRRIHRRSRDG